VVVLHRDLTGVAPRRDGPVGRIDVDDLVAGSQVDVPLLPELFGRDRDEVLQRLYLPLNVVWEPASR